LGLTTARASCSSATGAVAASAAGRRNGYWPSCAIAFGWRQSGLGWLKRQSDAARQCILDILYFVKLINTLTMSMALDFQGAIMHTDRKIDDRLRRFSHDERNDPRYKEISDKWPGLKQDCLAKLNHIGGGRDAVDGIRVCGDHLGSSSNIDVFSDKFRLLEDMIRTLLPR
jgi:hypothetical protein